MYEEDKRIEKKISKEKFDFVEDSNKNFDYKMKGKPISSLQDVWIRFKKNRTNLFASIMLLILVLLSLIMPPIYGDSYKKLDEKLAFLPPRVPLLEKLGIFDGIVEHKAIPVDLSMIDEETGLYMPLNFNKEAIQKESLNNYTIESTEMVPSVLHGQMVMKLDSDSNEMVVSSNEFFNILKANNSCLLINITEIDAENNGVIEVLMQTEFGKDFEVIETIEKIGEHKIDVFNKYPDLYADVVSNLQLRYKSKKQGSSVAIERIEVIEENSKEPVMIDEGYKLASYKVVDGKGTVKRQNGELIVADFKFNKYEAAFGLTHEIAFSSEDYDNLIEEWGSGVSKVANPNNPEGWLFTEGFPIREVVKKNDTVTVDGKNYSSYEVYLDYKAYLGYSDIPYYIFGTTKAGRDLFALVWIGLRTSLYIGIFVTLINISIGIVYGAISGFYGGIVDLLMQRFSEIMGRIPWLVLLSIMVVLFDPGIKTLILTLVISGWIGAAGVTRMQFYRYKDREYVLAAKTMGAKDKRLIFRHILPNGIGTIITSTVLSIPGVIFTEAALSYLGYGIGHGQSFNVFGIEFSGVSIGVLLSDGRNFLLNYPHMVIFPALIVSILMITFNMFGNALRDAFNPSLRGAE
jgi:ABC-type dipeptide/oligopeptide/nickel transport system permease subunit